MQLFRQRSGGRSAAAVPPRRADFVELHRRFSRVTKTSDRDDAADESYLLRAWTSNGRFDWQALLKKPLVVILGEQGSGKSWEIEHQAAELEAAGHFAFFIRLEDLVAQPMSSALDSAARRFNNWKVSSESATFFLDSVDESKLNGTEDFYSALKHFREALPADFAVRARIILSSRISEWHPETDGARVREYFGLTNRLEKIESEETTSSSSDEDSLVVVQIDPLDREQVATLARAKRSIRVDEFLTALDHAHAWEFARRPIDVIALADFSQQNGRIGTLTELIEFDLERNLREHRSRVGDPLSDNDARLGAEALAAGVVFCGQPGIKVPDANLTIAGLDGRLCVPTRFTRDQFDALLTRPVFDSASFGRVRFHHRRIREHLAASWVSKRMDAGCSLAELDGLFFDHIGGRRVLRSSRAAVAAWLCGGGTVWNAELRRWVLEASPDLNLRYGDPKALPLDYKQALLTKLVEAARTRGHLWLDTDPDALSRLADSALVPQIEAIIRDKQLASDLRSAMLEIVRHSRLSVCLPTVLDLIASGDEPDDLKVYAVAVLRELNEPASLIRLAKIAETLPRVTTALTDLIVDALFPSLLSVDELIVLLRKTYERNGRRPDLRWHIKRPLEERLQPEQAGLLLDRLITLLRAEPHLPAESGGLAVSQEFAWLWPLTTVALLALLKKSALTPEEVTSASAALAIASSRHEGPTDRSDDKSTVQKLTLEHPAVRSSFFWATVRRRRPLGVDAVDHPLDIFPSYRGLLDPAQADVEWLVQDLAVMTDEADREVALRHAMEWCIRMGRPRWLCRSIQRAVGPNHRLLDLLRELNRNGRIRSLKRHYFLLEHAYLQYRRRGERAYGMVVRRINQVRSYLFLRRNLGKIARGELFDVVNSLVGEADPENRSRWTVSRWNALECKWGALVVAATRVACKNFWRTFQPELAHECADPSRVPNGIIVGLTGLQAEWSDGELDLSALSDHEAKLASRYAMREINGFPPWMHPLAECQPGPVGEVFDECINAEWNQPADRQYPYEGLQRLTWSDAPLLPSVRSSVLARLQTGDPSGRALGLVLGHLLNSPMAPVAELASLARSRVANTATTKGPLALWFAVWLQIEPATAIAAWQEHARPRADADDVMVLVGSFLQDRDIGHGPRFAESRYRTVSILQQLLPIVFAHIKPAEDIHREGGYTPDARDYAQEFRTGLLRELADSSDATAADVLLELATLPVFTTYRDWLLHLREENLRQQADRDRWRPSDIRQFELQHETDPQTDRDLYRIVLKRLSDIKNDVERSDLGLRTHLRSGDIEARLRIWLAQELIRRSRQRYTVPQEAVIDQNQRPDIRLENTHTDAVSVEIKWAQDWSFNQLTEALEGQLFGQYLRAHNSRHGVLVLGMHDGGRQSWKPPTGGGVLFPELVTLLQGRAAELERLYPEIKQLTVIGIDFREPNR